MKYDEYGIPHCSTNELVDLLYRDPTLKLENFFVDDAERYNGSVKQLHAGFPTLKNYAEYFVNRDAWASIEEFDSHNQKNWFIPKEYDLLDIEQHIINLCETQEQLERVNLELSLYKERNLFNLLKFLKYLIDTLRDNEIVWGVGRGSSVSSYVLYLLGVHKIDSIKFELDIKEFLK